MNVDTSTLRDALPHHEIGDELGRGRFGVVVAARHQGLGRDDAIRFLAGAPAADALPGLDHPHLVRVYNRVAYD
nr:hypothetical protein [Micromonospora sp. DSM 115978]